MIQLRAALQSTLDSHQLSGLYVGIDNSRNLSINTNCGKVVCLLPGVAMSGSRINAKERVILERLAAEAIEHKVADLLEFVELTGSILDLQDKLDALMDMSEIIKTTDLPLFKFDHKIDFHNYGNYSNNTIRASKLGSEMSSCKVIVNFSSTGSVTKVEIDADDMEELAACNDLIDKFLIAHKSNFAYISELDALLRDSSKNKRALTSCFA